VWAHISQAGETSTWRAANTAEHIPISALSNPSGGSSPAGRYLKVRV